MKYFDELTLDETLALLGMEDEDNPEFWEAVRYAHDVLRALVQ